MVIHERRVGPVTILALSGRLVLDDGDVLLRRAGRRPRRQGEVRIVIDFTELDYVDSAGIGVLIAKYLSVRRKGGDLKLLRLSSRAHHALEITHLLTVFETFETEDEAVTASRAELAAGPSPSPAIITERLAPIVMVLHLALVLVLVAVRRAAGAPARSARPGRTAASSRCRRPSSRTSRRSTTWRGARSARGRPRTPT